MGANWDTYPRKNIPLLLARAALRELLHNEPRGIGPPLRAEDEDTSHALVHDVSFEAGQHAMSSFNESPGSGTASLPAPSGAAPFPLSG